MPLKRRSCLLFVIAVTFLLLFHNFYLLESDDDVIKRGIDQHPQDGAASKPYQQSTQAIEFKDLSVTVPFTEIFSEFPSYRDELKAVIERKFVLPEEYIVKRKLYNPRAIQHLHGHVEFLDLEWIPILQSGDVVHVESFSLSLSEKYKISIRDPASKAEYAAVVKPCYEKELLADNSSFPTIDFFRMKNPFALRTGRIAQGSSEIISFHIDRILHLHRKPPIVGRMISSRILYNVTDDIEAQKWLKLPEFQVPVALVPWMTDIKTIAPKEHIGRILTMAQDIPYKDRQLLQTVKDMSDATLFDFLVDDHDRARSYGNWLVDHLDRVLLWDTGIGWYHGPVGDDSCLIVLCGAASWTHPNNESTLRNHIKGCQPICRFSAYLVDRLIRRGPLASSEDFSLGSLLKKSLEREMLQPIWQYLRFFTTEQREHPVHFLADNFYYGINVRIANFLGHLKACADQYGWDQVIL